LQRQAFPVIFQALELQKNCGWKPVDFQRVEQVCLDRYAAAPRPPGKYR